MYTSFCPFPFEALYYGAISDYSPDHYSILFYYKWRCCYGEVWFEIYDMDVYFNDHYFTSTEILHYDYEWYLKNHYQDFTDTACIGQNNVVTVMCTLSSCWAEITLGDPLNHQSPNLYAADLPCYGNSGCCYQVVKIDAGGNITYEGDPVFEGSCEGSYITDQIPSPLVTWQGVLYYISPTYGWYPVLTEGVCQLVWDALLGLSRISNYDYNTQPLIKIKYDYDYKNNNILLNISSESNTEYSFQILDLVGREISNTKSNIEKGINNIEKDFSNYSSGFYILNIFEGSILLKSIKVTVIK
jgi:hypothetical protein